MKHIHATGDAAARSIRAGNATLGDSVISDSTAGDTELVAATLDGSDAAFESLVRRHSRAAYLVALACTGVASDAEDAVQDAMLQAFERLADCHSPDRFGAWLLSIVRNRAHNVRRRELLRRPAQNQNAKSDAGDFSDHVWPGEPPDLQIERLELRQTLLQALSLEPEVRRQILLLHDVEGWKHKDIAEAVGVSVLMSRFHLSAVRRSMRARLAQFRTSSENE